MGLVSMSTPIRDGISAAPPRCSPNTRPGGEIVYPENNREVMPKLSRIKVESRCSAYRKSFEIKLKYESRIYSNSFYKIENLTKISSQILLFSHFIK